MKHYWELARARVDDLSLRERAMIFAASVFVVVALLNAMLLDPLLAKKKELTAQVVQQQEKMKELHATMQSLLQAKEEDKNSPLRARGVQLKRQLQDQDAYLQSLSDRLVEPARMAELLEQVLNKNGKLQLIALKTLPVSLLIEKPQDVNTNTNVNAGQKQVFKHGVQITIRGGYLDLMQYLTELEKMPTQMFWGEAGLSVEKYPNAVLTLTLYTLCLDKAWLTV